MEKRRRIALLALPLALIAALAIPAAAQRSGWPADPSVTVVLAPFMGVSMMPGFSGVLHGWGVQVAVPGERRVRLIGRFEGWHHNENYVGNLGSVELYGRVFGSEIRSLGLTGGWMRWDDHHFVTGSLRGMHAIHADRGEPGGPSVQAWFNLGLRGREASAPATGVETEVWFQMKFNIVLPIRFTWRR